MKKVSYYNYCNYALSLMIIILMMYHLFSYVFINKNENNDIYLKD